MDIDAIKRAKEGNVDDIGNILLENMNSMYRVAFSILTAEEKVYDAISNTIVIVFEKINTLKKEEYFKTWLTRILINECYKISRQNNKIIYLENCNKENLSYNDTYPDFETRELVNNLDKNLRKIVVLYYFEDFSVKQIAKMLQIPEGTVKSRLSRARKELEKELIAKETEKKKRMGGGI